MTTVTTTKELISTLRAAITALRSLTVPAAYLPVCGALVELLAHIADDIAWRGANEVDSLGQDCRVVPRDGYPTPGWDEAVRLARAILAATSCAQVGV